MVYIDSKAYFSLMVLSLLLALYCGICAFIYVSVCYLALCVASIVLLTVLFAYLCK